MCGFAGVLRPRANVSADELAGNIGSMMDAIVHRGPDGSGRWVDAEAGVALGHRRLAILDLSEAGHQPMASTSGRFQLAYNGEIYNHMELRRHIEEQGGSRSWRGHSDTEVLIAAIELWGLPKALSRATGMFALALWDRETATLSLARDRMGEKPLYYGWQGLGWERAFLFGSELAALKQHPSFVGRISRRALTAYMKLSCVPAPLSIYEGIAKLEPGTVLTLSAGETDPVIRPYWSLTDVVRRGQSDPFKGAPDEAVEALGEIAGSAVRRQMVSDVPLGAFLSGGVDSSAVVSLMQAASPRPVKTFTIGFDESGYDEAVHAKDVARHLGTEHHELYVDPATALSVIPDLPDIYSEPFADSSQVPTVLVSRLARVEVTVALSGDGGDELFCGYNRYTLAARAWSGLRRVPRLARRAAAVAITALPPSALTAFGDTALRRRLPQLGDKLHKTAAVLPSTSVSQLYDGLVSAERNAAAWVVGGVEPAVQHGHDETGPLDPMATMMLMDATGYLPDDILTKVDRAAMSVSLETRVPFLDHHVVEFAWSLPADYKLRDGVSKWPLRQLLHRHVPRELIERPKMGFAVPVADWLRGELREWAEALLAPQRLRREGYWNEPLVTGAWAEHLSGRRNHLSKLWNVLMFQAWLERHG